ncbi:DUF1266 domain-containing protein [Streptomyces sp. CS62]|uniref:DUF1266 domain-containing protein n=1 Tax=Streptomyces sp. CS62 TaxID=3119268 RepID=UPI003FA76C64
MGNWIAPSAIERELYGAKAAGDWGGYFDALARAELFVPQDRHFQDANPRAVWMQPVWFPQARAQCFVAYTAGMLPPPTPDQVFSRHSLSWFAHRIDPGDPPYLAVNPGTPCEAFLPASPADREVWKGHWERADRYGLEQNAVHALHVGGPLHGPVAFGLACGAHLSVHNGQFWNALGHHGAGYLREREKLREWWGVTTREEWLSAVERLLAADMVSSVWEFALRVRTALAREFAGPVDIEHWRHATEATLRANAERAAEPRLTPDGVTVSRPRSTAEIEGEVAGVQRVIGRIARYEQRFRADGILGEGRWVRSVRGLGLRPRLPDGPLGRRRPLRDRRGGRGLRGPGRADVPAGVPLLGGPLRRLHPRPLPPVRRGGVRALVHGHGRHPRGAHHRPGQPLAEPPLEPGVMSATGR